MQPSSAVAFKEWAAICEALAAGHQTIILRKGGIHEGRDDFRVAHDEFWLFPTHFHQAADNLIPAGRLFAEHPRREPSDEDRVRIQLYATVQEVRQLHEERLIDRLAGHHIWSQATVAQRFHYRQPGLFLLLVRVYKTLDAFELANSPYFSGCRSWVELPGELATATARPVLSDDEYAVEARAVLAAVSPQPA